MKINKKKLSVIISVMNAVGTTKFCLKCLRDNIDESKSEIIIVDNASADGTAEWLNTEKGLRVIRNDEPHSLAASFNQGLALATGDEILFMHNDTFLPPNTVSRLEDILFRQEKIGAVSPVSQQNLMEMNCVKKEIVPYNDFKTLSIAAEKLFAEYGDEICGQLIAEDVCLLAKREAIEETGAFDERFAVRFGEDFDYSLRMVQAGWNLARAEGILVHHQPGVTFAENKLDADKALQMFLEVLEKKWGIGFNYSATARLELLEKIDYSLPDLAVLDIGCAMGGNLAAVRVKRPDARLCGIELNPNTASIAAAFGEIKQADVETLELPEWEETFDYIIMGDILEHLREPKELLIKAKKLLKKNGVILTSIPNVMNAYVVAGLLDGRWEYQQSGILDRTHLRFFTRKEIYNLFEEAGYTAECFSGSKNEPNDFLQRFYNEMKQLKTVAVDTEQMEYIQFYFKAIKKDI